MEFRLLFLKTFEKTRTTFVFSFVMSLIEELRTARAILVEREKVFSYIFINKTLTHGSQFGEAPFYKLSLINFMCQMFFDRVNWEFFEQMHLST